MVYKHDTLIPITLSTLDALQNLCCRSSPPWLGKPHREQGASPPLCIPEAGVIIHFVSSLTHGHLCIHTAMIHVPWHWPQLATSQRSSIEISWRRRVLIFDSMLCY